ncbi:hypothetical protein Ct61P_02330 [Colletotrichum tofieldiae]|nr:hypothetical protein Ct61P_02330 [Colletotrichum tofieldiae]
MNQAPAQPPPTLSTDFTRLAAVEVPFAYDVELVVHASIRACGGTWRARFPAATGLLSTGPDACGLALHAVRVYEGQQVDAQLVDA